MRMVNAVFFFFFLISVSTRSAELQDQTNFFLGSVGHKNTDEPLAAHRKTGLLLPTE